MSSVGKVLYNSGLVSFGIGLGSVATTAYNFYSTTKNPFMVSAATACASVEMLMGNSRIERMVISSMYPKMGATLDSVSTAFNSTCTYVSRSSEDQKLLLTIGGCLIVAGVIAMVISSCTNSKVKQA